MEEGAHGTELLVQVTVQLVVDKVPIELAVGPSMKPSSDTDIIRMIILIAATSTRS